MLAVLLCAWLGLGGQGEVVRGRGKGGLTVSEAALAPVVLDRYGYGENGRELLELFLKSRLLDHLAAKQGLRVGEEAVTQRWKELEKRSLASGQPLTEEIRRRNLTPTQFREFLRLALLQERLTRQALGLSSSAEVSGDQQEIWLSQEIRERGLELEAPGEGLEGVMARCGEISITREEFARFLLERVAREELRESAWHLLLLQAIEKRMPDLSSEARGRAVEAELVRRREKHALEYPAISFEQRLGATGRTLASLRRDPSVAIAALSRLWVDRTAGPEGVRSTYEKEREGFEARYGEAVQAGLLFRVAGRFVNDLCPRTFEQGEEELKRLAGRIGSEPEFSAQVAQLSEEPNTKKNGGELGWVTRGDGRVPRELREALFRVLDTGGTIPADGRLIGPVRVESGLAGVALLWAKARRPSPPWEEMSERVHEDLRRRFLEELMPKESVELVATSG